MAIVKNGSVTVVSGGNAQNLNIGFVPTRFTMWNQTKIVASPAAEVIQVQWMPQLANASAWLWTQAVTTGILSLGLITSGGITPYTTPAGLEFVPLTGLPPGAVNTNLTITGITNAAHASITATHAFTSADIGVTTVGFHGVNGMNQINTLTGVIQSVTSTTSFTVNINTTNFSSWTSGGIANIITGVPPTTTVGFQTFNTPLSNVGFTGLILGADVMINTSDVWLYEAVLDAPFTS